MTGGWIVTLDVLKCDKKVVSLEALERWIVTLDVLKSDEDIHIMIILLSWIVTLDVLKYRFGKSGTKWH